MLQASRAIDMPVIATTQLRAKLGETCHELRLDMPDGYQTLAHVDKSAFSMYTPQIKETLAAHSSTPCECIIVGIETHICVLQTTLALLEAGHKVYVLADGVSSCNREEIPIALERIRRAGAVVTTSESILYEIMGDAAFEGFKQIADLVKETKADTKTSLQVLCPV